MELSIFLVCKGNYNCEKNDEKCCEYQLTATEHIFILHKANIITVVMESKIKHGMQYKIEEVFEEIQKSNMSKLGLDGKPIYREDGKVLKGPNYFKPNIKSILEN